MLLTKTMSHGFVSSVVVEGSITVKMLQLSRTITESVPDMSQSTR